MSENETTARDFAPLTTSDLERFARRARAVASALADGRPPEFGTTQHLAVAMALRRVMGAEWADHHFNPNKPLGRFFVTSVGPDPEASLQEYTRKFLRMTHLVASIYELQHLDNFRDRLIQLQKQQLESVYAELDIVRMLRAHNIPTWFRPEHGPDGVKNYDIDIMLDDQTMAAAEIKCRVESTALSQSGVVAKLKEAGKQLRQRDDRPTIIWMNIPGAWLQDPATAGTMTAAIDEFFRKNETVCAVAYQFRDVISTAEGLPALAIGFVHQINELAKHRSPALERLFGRMRKKTRSDAFLTEEVKRALAAPWKDHEGGAPASLKNVQNGRCTFHIWSTPQQKVSFPVDPREAERLITRRQSEPDSFWVSLDANGRPYEYSDLDDHLG